jgi:hypothetical protein
MEEQNQQKRSSKSGHPNDRDWSNPRNAQSPHARNIFRVEAENNQESFDPKDIPQEPPNPPPQSCERDFGPNHQGGRGWRQRKRSWERQKSTRRKAKWFCIFHKENYDHNSNYYPDKKGI